MKNTNNTTKGFKKVFVGMTTARDNRRDRSERRDEKM